jgi:hypothetical protein
MGAIVPIEWPECQFQALLNLDIVVPIERLFDIDNGATLG